MDFAMLCQVSFLFVYAKKIYYPMKRCIRIEIVCVGARREVAEIIAFCRLMEIYGNHEYICVLD